MTRERINTAKRETVRNKSCASSQSLSKLITFSSSLGPAHRSLSFSLYFHCSICLLMALINEHHPPTQNPRASTVSSLHSNPALWSILVECCRGNSNPGHLMLCLFDLSCCVYLWEPRINFSHTHTPTSLIINISYTSYTFGSLTTGKKR